MDDYLEFAAEVCDATGDAWEVQDESTLICPHGNPIEWDGYCPNGCESPLRAAGLI
jgi:hypothetical protein